MQILIKICPAYHISFNQRNRHRGEKIKGNEAIEKKKEGKVINLLIGLIISCFGLNLLTKILFRVDLMIRIYD